MTTAQRRKLPWRRELRVFEFQHEGVAYTAHVGELKIFLRGGRVGSAIETAARDLAIVTSLALQHGTPLEAIRHALTKCEDGKGAGPIGKLLDLIAEEGA